jgi:hypothetical protein
LPSPRLHCCRCPGPSFPPAPASCWWWATCQCQIWNWTWRDLPVACSPACPAPSWVISTATAMWLCHPPRRHTLPAWKQLSRQGMRRCWCRRVQCRSCRMLGVCCCARARLGARAQRGTRGGAWVTRGTRSAARKAAAQQLGLDWRFRGKGIGFEQHVVGAAYELQGNGAVDMCVVPHPAGLYGCDTAGVRRVMYCGQVLPLLML